jgi:pSer/pThr/pTyr-binding forkhead associated (FHA) protein
LLLTRGPETGRRFALPAFGTVGLGRHPDCEIPLPDITVSRRHAEIQPGSGQFLLTDTGSLNGTYVNQQPVDTIALNDGDEIAIGIFRFVFSAGG